MNPPPPQPPENDFRDEWRPVDKAAEAAIENPAEFEPRPATESSEGPRLDGDEWPLKTPGDPAIEKLEE